MTAFAEVFLSLLALCATAEAYESKEFMPELLDLVKKNALVRRSVEIPTSQRGPHKDGDRDRRAATAIAAKTAIQQILKQQAMDKAQEAGKEGVADVQAKAVEIAGEIASKALDSAFDAISDAKNRSESQLMNGAKVDVKLDEAFQGKSVIYPGDVSMTAEFDNEPLPPEESNQFQPIYYIGGTGAMLQNGCFDNAYVPGTDCYEGASAGTVCGELLDAASFIGVGFDGRSNYNAESRKLSLIQRDCSKGSTYDGKQVPDMMIVQGIYDTEANTFVFGSRDEYRYYLEEGAAVGDSKLVFVDGIRNAYGQASSETTEMYLAVMDMNIMRYEILLDAVKPQNLNPSFLDHFMSLPRDFDGPGHAAQFIAFILRWGTHYVKASPVGGQLEIRKASGVGVTQDLEAFASEAREDFEGIFRSSRARDYLEQSNENKLKQEAQALSLNAQGGEPHVAAILTDMYAPGFKTALVSWLQSLVDYPKPFLFKLGRITDLVNFKEGDLFPSEDADVRERWGCEAKRAAGELLTDEITGEKYYIVHEEIVKPDGEIQVVERRKYCKHLDRAQLTHEIAQKRRALDRAISIYLEEGPISTTDTFVPGTGTGCTTPYRPSTLPDDPPTWEELLAESDSFHVSFDMQADLQGQGGLVIPAKSGHDVVFEKNKWYKRSQDGVLHLFNGFDNGDSGNTASMRLSLQGLVMDYNEEDGTLYMTSDAYEASDLWHSTTAEKLVNMSLAFISPETISSPLTPEAPLPCNVHWSNINRMGIDYCLKFSASSESTIFAVFSAVPRLIDTWFYVRMARDEASIHKANRKIISTLTKNAASIGTKDLYRNYLICATENQYGQFQLYHGLQSDDLAGGTILLPFYDIAGFTFYPLQFFAFGCGNDDVRITDISVVPYGDLNVECGTGVVEDGICFQERCGPECKELGCIEYVTEDGDLDYICSGALNPKDCLCSCILENNPASPSGVYRIELTGIELPFNVHCDMESDGGGWTTFQMRFDGSVDFVRNSDEEYKSGFGSAIVGEYWLGIDTLMIILARDQERRNDLRIDIEDWDGDHAHAIYHNFNMEVPGFTLDADYDASKSTAGDGFSKYQDYGKPFRAHCEDDDRTGGGHWKSDGCNSYASLNGRYYEGFYYEDAVTDWVDGVVWPTDWHPDRNAGTCSACAEYYSLKKTEMKVRNLHV